MRVWLLFRLGATCLALSSGATNPPPVQSRRTSSACYSSGGDCGFHSLACDHAGDVVISVDTMHYGFKERAAYANLSCQALLPDCGADVSLGACCVYDDMADCQKAYSPEHRQRVKEDCDGRVTCSFRATVVTGSCSRPPHVYSDVSSYSIISYVCVSADSRRTSSSSSSSGIASSQPSGCGSGGCGSTTTLTTVAGADNDSKQRENDERVEQLIIGVSVGLGAGFIFLVLVLIACWIRIRRKPHESLSFRSGPSAVSGIGQGRDSAISRRPSKAYTFTSTMPSSLYSSFLYSDTLPSSHPGSVYPADSSIYSVPIDDYDNGSGGSSIGPASLLRAGYSNGNVPVVAPAQGSSWDLVIRPRAAEFAAAAATSAATAAERERDFPPVPTTPARGSSEDGSVPPELPARPSILKPIVRPKESFVNGGGGGGGFLAVSSTSSSSSFAGPQQLSGTKRSGSESSSSRVAGTAAAPASSRRRSHSSSSRVSEGGPPPTPRFFHAGPPSRKTSTSKTGSSVSTGTGGSSGGGGGGGEMGGGGGPPASGRHGEISLHPSGLEHRHHHHPEASRRHSKGSTTSSPSREWWNLRDSVQSGDHSGDVYPPVVPGMTEEEEDGNSVGALPVGHQSQDRHEAVETWLGKVKHHVPF